MKVISLHNAKIYIGTFLVTDSSLINIIGDNDSDTIQKYDFE